MNILPVNTTETGTDKTDEVDLPRHHHKQRTVEMTTFVCEHNSNGYREGDK